MTECHAEDGCHGELHVRILACLLRVDNDEEAVEEKDEEGNELCHPFQHAILLVDQTLQTQWTQCEGDGNSAFLH